MKNNEEKRTAMARTRIHESAIHKIGTRLSYSAMKVYLYINFNCNLASGITHRLSYSQIAEYWGMHIASVYRGIAELEEANLFEITHTGDFVGIIPHQGLMNQMVHAESYERKERAFYKELRRRIEEKSEGRTTPLPFGGVCRLYERLVAERAKDKKFYPKADGFNHLRDKLEYYGFALVDPD